MLRGGEGLRAATFHLRSVGTWLFEQRRLQMALRIGCAGLLDEPQEGVVMSMTKICPHLILR